MVANSSGSTTAVTSVFSAIASPENAPATASSWRARDVPIPCDDMPIAKPRTR